MSDAITLIKGPEESIKAFNRRLEEVFQKDPITDVEGALVNGLPVLTLLTETVYADEDGDDADPKADADDADPKADADDADPKADADDAGDDFQIDGPPLGCAIIELRAGTGEEAARSEKWCARVLERAAGAVVDVKYLTGQRMGWAKPPIDAAEAKTVPYSYVTQDVTYLLVLWELDETDVGDDDDDDDVKDAEVLPPAKK